LETIRKNRNGQTGAQPTVEVLNPDGTSPVVLVCEHASNVVPEEFGGLGLSAQALQSHIAWDPGAMDVAAEISKILDAPLVHQTVSRLLYDCNRPPEAASAVPAKSEIFDIPGNMDLDDAARAQRIDMFYRPFEKTLSDPLDMRTAWRRPPVIVTIHSFTPVFEGKRRNVGIGVLHDEDTRFADAVLGALEVSEGIVVARNQPYGPADGVTHTLVAHGLSRGLLNVMIEMRNDLLSSKNEQKDIARQIATAVMSALGTPRIVVGDGH